MRLYYSKQSELNDDVSYKSQFETNASYTNRLSDGNLAQ